MTFNLLTPPTHIACAQRPRKTEQVLMEDSSDTCQLICSIVMYLIYGSNSLARPTASVRAFKSYIKSILECTGNNVTPPVIMVSLFYVAKYVEKYVDLVNQLIEPDSQERIWTAALMMADAFMNDSAYATKSWALVSKIPLEECILMRRGFMEVLDYDLAIHPSAYCSWVNDAQAIYSTLKLNSAANALHLSRPSMTMTPPLASYAVPLVPSSIYPQHTLALPPPNQIDYNSYPQYVQQHHLVPHTFVPDYTYAPSYSYYDQIQMQGMPARSASSMSWS